ncbi:MAG: hypothetical protein J6M31_01800 [Bacteroidales bacterium]|nr:hypothetical protein [Bacteroidales bacterium]MBP3202322.1 hypothetical protein [Bacteroidales bacterium]
MNGIQMKDFDLSVNVEYDSAGRIVSGLVVGDILNQNQALILALHKGELKSDVSVGVGIDRMINDSDWLSWQREIRDQLEMDGQTVESVLVDSKSIKIKASYV